jgi:Protein of unknown function (DUF1579)
MVTSMDVGRVPRPVVPGSEMDELRRFHRDMTWTGTIAPDGMGPGTPPMNADGSGRHELIQDGRWIVGNYVQDQYLLDGSFVLTWNMHWVAGWDPARGEYRATVADNYGHAEVMRGRIEGDRLLFESLDDAAVRLRLVWDVSDPARVVWRNEMSVDGVSWSLVEEYTCHPS